MSHESRLRRDGFVLAPVAGLLSGGRGAIGADDGGASCAGGGGGGGPFLSKGGLACVGGGYDRWGCKPCENASVLGGGGGGGACVPLFKR